MSPQVPGTRHGGEDARGQGNAAAEERAAPVRAAARETAAGHRVGPFRAFVFRGRRRQRGPRAARQRRRPRLRDRQGRPADGERARRPRQAGPQGRRDPRGRVRGAGAALRRQDHHLRGPGRPAVRHRRRRRARARARRGPDRAGTGSRRSAGTSWPTSSHELKTPVGALALLAETIEDAADDAEAVRRFAGRMRQEAARLTFLVQDLITLSRIQAAEPVPDPAPGGHRRGGRRGARPVPDEGERARHHARVDRRPRAQRPRRGRPAGDRRCGTCSRTLSSTARSAPGSWSASRSRATAASRSA